MERDKTKRTIEEQYRQIQSRRHEYLGNSWHACQPIVVEMIVRSDKNRYITAHTTGRIY